MCLAQLDLFDVSDFQNLNNYFGDCNVIIAVGTDGHAGYGIVCAMEVKILWSSQTKDTQSFKEEGQGIT